MKVDVAGCLHCKKAHSNLQATKETAKNGRSYASWVCPETGKKGATWLAGDGKPKPAAKPSGKPAASASGGAGDDVIVQVVTPPAQPTHRRGAGSGGSVKKDGDCRVVSAWQLHGRPVIDICDQELIPLADGLIEAMIDAARASQPGHALVAEADRDPGSCCTESGVNVGEQLYKVFVRRLLAHRLGAAEWLAMLPEDVAVATATGALDRAADGSLIGPDETRTKIGDGVVTLWQRMAGGASGAAIGSRAGPYGAAVGGLIGALFPEIAGAAEDAIGDLFGGDGTQLSLPMSGPVSGMPTVMSAQPATLPTTSDGRVVLDGVPSARGGLSPARIPGSGFGQLAAAGQDRTQSTLSQLTAAAPVAREANAGMSFGLNLGPVGLSASNIKLGNQRA